RSMCASVSSGGRSRTGGSTDARASPSTCRGTPGAIASSSAAGTAGPTAPRLPSSARRRLEERLPTREQGCEVVARCPVRCDEVDIRPVFGQLPLELGDTLLAPRDLPLDELDRALLLL